MSIFPFRDSWEVWRQKVNEALGSIEPIPASNITFDNSGTEVTATTAQGAIAEVAGDVASVAGVVGDENSGLVKDVAGVNDNINKLGAKNLLPNNFNSNTIEGVVFTKNEDGTITANGTTTGEIDSTDPRNIFQGNIPKGRYIISDGQPSGTASSAQAMYYSINNTSAHWVNSESEIEIENDSDVLKVWLYATSDKAYDNVIYKPMIRLATNTDDTYVPYAMSNRELTEAVSGNTIIVKDGRVDVKASAGTVADLMYSLSTAIGNVLSNLADNETLEVYRINIQSHANVFPQLKILTNQSYADFYGIAVESTATTCDVYRLTLEHSSASNNKLRKCHLDGTGNVFQTPSDESITDERTYSAYYRIFKKI